LKFIRKSCAFAVAQFSLKADHPMEITQHLLHDTLSVVSPDPLHKTPHLGDTFDDMSVHVGQFFPYTVGMCGVEIWHSVQQHKSTPVSDLVRLLAVSAR
jgi:hypothetical protein